jgi:hypothetical protein
MKFLLSCLLALSLSTTALAQDTQSWLSLLNAEPGREQKLTEKDVLFKPASDPRFSGVVAVGFRQSDGSYSLGSVIWQGKLWRPLVAFANILRSQGFVEADDSARQELFLSLLEQIHGSLGIHPYTGEKSRQENRPQPITGQRQVDGKHRFLVWFWVEPGHREGAEWRQVRYVVSMEEPAVTVKTLQTFHPVAERLRGFPSTP